MYHLNKTGHPVHIWKRRFDGAERRKLTKSITLQTHIFSDYDYESTYFLNVQVLWDNMVTDLERLQNLITLKIDNQPLIILPPPICTLKHLRRLSLGNCGLTSLSAQFGFLKSLKMLDISGNTFSYLPDCIGSINSLRTLIANSCKLRSLPAWLISSSISLLRASNNLIDVIPGSYLSIYWLTDAQSLDLSRNPLKTKRMQLPGGDSVSFDEPQPASLLRLAGMRMCMQYVIFTSFSCMWTSIHVMISMFSASTIRSINNILFSSTSSDAAWCLYARQAAHVAIGAAGGAACGPACVRPMRTRLCGARASASLPDMERMTFISHFFLSFSFFLKLCFYYDANNCLLISNFLSHFA